MPQIEASAVIVIGRLEQLIMISQSAWRKMKADPRDAATFGHWLDFLVNSVCNENDQISKAIRELDVARYFLLHLRLLDTIGYLRYNFKPAVPEFNDLDGTSHLTRLMETLLASNEKDEADLSTNQIHTIVKSFREGLFRRAKPGQVECQQTGELLRGVAGFCLRGEAECALILAAKRQQSEWALRFYLPDCQCSAGCEYNLCSEGDHPFRGKRYAMTYGELAPYCSKTTATLGLRTPSQH